MHDLLEFFSLRDFIPLVLLIFLLEFVGTQMGGDSSTVRWWARGLAGAGFFLYAGFGIAEWKPATPEEFLTIGLRAVLAMGTAHGLARVTLPVACFLYEHLWRKPNERQQAWAEEQARQAAAQKQAQELAEREKAERDRREEAARRRQEEIARRPPPPTREELLAAAQQRYETNLRVLASAGLDDIELKAAQEKAKQQYLRELDGLMT